MTPSKSAASRSCAKGRTPSSSRPATWSTNARGRDELAKAGKKATVIGRLQLPLKTDEVLAIAQKTAAGLSRWEDNLPTGGLDAELATHRPNRRGREIEEPLCPSGFPRAAGSRGCPGLSHLGIKSILRGLIPGHHGKHEGHGYATQQKSSSPCVDFLTLTDTVHELSAPGKHPPAGEDGRVLPEPAGREFRPADLASSPAHQNGFTRIVADEQVFSGQAKCWDSVGFRFHRPAANSSVFFKRVLPVTASRIKNSALRLTA